MDRIEKWEEVRDKTPGRWELDPVLAANGPIRLYYKGGPCGVFVQVHEDINTVEFGSYDGYFQYITDACFMIDDTRIFDELNMAQEFAASLRKE